MRTSKNFKILNCFTTTPKMQKFPQLKLIKPNQTNKKNSPFMIKFVILKYSTHDYKIQGVKGKTNA